MYQALLLRNVPVNNRYNIMLECSVSWCNKIIKMILIIIPGCVPGEGVGVRY